MQPIEKTIEPKPFILYHFANGKLSYYGEDMTKALFDWELIRREYSTAQFTDSELAKRHGCSRTAIQKRAAKETWTRDNSARVRALAQSRMVKEDAKVAAVAAQVAGSPAQVQPGATLEELEQQEIELAAETRIAVLRKHRRQVDSAGKGVEILLAQLIEFSQHRDELETIIEEETDPGKRRAYMMKAVSMPSQAAVIRDLTSALRNLLPLEREAFNMDDKRGGDDNLPVVVVHDPERGTYIEGQEEDVENS